jgi:hypothetical protein
MRLLSAAILAAIATLSAQDPAGNPSSSQPNLALPRTSGAPAAATLVLPAAYATRWGELANSFPFGNASMRYQQVHLGTDIPSPTPLFSIGFREDETYSASGGMAQLTIKLGLTSFDHNTIGFTSSFDANYDSGPATTVFTGNVNLPRLAGTNANLATFAVLIPFRALYVYVPQANRHLLLEVAATSANTGYYDKVNANASLGTVSRIWATNAAAANASGGVRNDGLVVCFNNVPTCGLATFAEFGAGCAGSSGTPRHTATGVPALGGSYTLALASARPGPAWLFLDTQRATWGPIPLPLDLGAFGAPGCSVLVPGTAVLGVTVGASGGVAVPVAVPNVPQYCGTRVYTQFVVADPANRLGFVFSNGGDSSLGN